MPDTDAEDFGDDGVAVDRLAGGAVDYATVLAEMRAIDDEEAGAEGTDAGVATFPVCMDVARGRKKKGVFGGASIRIELKGRTTGADGERSVVPGPAQQT